MATIYGLVKLRALEDWIPVVSERNWRAKHSAFELGHKWHGGNLPPAVQRVFTKTTERALQDLRIEYAIAEKPVFLDTSRAPSMTDLMVYCRNARDERIIIGVEGKARERFADPIKDWIQNGKKTRLRRLDFLNKTLGTSFAPNSSVRYQLLHRTASVVLESLLYGAKAAVLLIHSFSENDPTNWNDFLTFGQEIGLKVRGKDALFGPANVGPSKNIALFTAWVEDAAKS